MDETSWNSKEMVFILLVLYLSSVCGELREKTTFYQAEENDNITIRWDSKNQTDMSLTNMICFLLSKPEKVFYKLMDGVELPEFQHQQFSGRVQCDRDALREGRVTLHLSRVTAEDSGRYRCEMVNYNKKLRRWELQAKFRFVLNVTPTSHEESFMSPITTKPGLVIIKGATHQEGGLKIGVILDVLAMAAFVCGVIVGIREMVNIAKQQKDIHKSERERDRERESERETESSLSCCYKSPTYIIRMALTWIKTKLFQMFENN